MLFYVPRLHHQRMSQRPTVYQNAPWAFSFRGVTVPCRPGLSLFVHHIFSPVSRTVFHPGKVCAYVTSFCEQDQPGGLDYVAGSVLLIPEQMIPSFGTILGQIVFKERTKVIA